MQSLISGVLAQVGQVVLGKPTQIKLALACLLAKGHLLIEDLPGMGKTTLAHVLASTLGLSYQRSQFTSDLLPADVVGISVFNTESQSFDLHKGPIFNQVVLADEINRASPKTQSALLEAMEEGRVSIDGTTHDLPSPFFVIATQNPMFHAGTYPLPESQLDRFMMKLSLGFPDLESEKKILLSSSKIGHFEQEKACLTLEQLQNIQHHIEGVFTSDAILEYIIALFQHSRDGSLAVNPLSPRAGKSLLCAAKAWAFIDNRDHVLPEDIQAVFANVCEHRLNSSANSYQENSNYSAQILAKVDPVISLNNG